MVLLSSSTFVPDTPLQHLYTCSAPAQSNLLNLSFSSPPPLQLCTCTITTSAEPQHSAPAPTPHIHLCTCCSTPLHLLYTCSEPAQSNLLNLSTYYSAPQHLLLFGRNRTATEQSPLLNLRTYHTQHLSNLRICTTASLPGCSVNLQDHLC